MYTVQLYSTEPESRTALWLWKTLAALQLNCLSCQGLLPESNLETQECPKPQVKKRWFLTLLHFRVESKILCTTWSLWARACPWLTDCPTEGGAPHLYPVQACWVLHRIMSWVNLSSVELPREFLCWSPGSWEHWTCLSLSCPLPVYCLSHMSLQHQASCGQEFSLKHTANKPRKTGSQDLVGRCQARLLAQLSGKHPQSGACPLSQHETCCLYSPTGRVPLGKGRWCNASNILLQILYI